MQDFFFQAVLFLVGCFICIRYIYLVCIRCAAAAVVAVMVSLIHTFVLDIIDYRGMEQSNARLLINEMENSSLTNGKIKTNNL